MVAVENTVPKIQNSENKANKVKEKSPKPIMIREIMDIVSFTTKLEAERDPDFLVEIAGRWLKFITNSFATKNKIINYLKEQ